MVKIEISDGQLKISNSTKELFEWNHRSFFNLSLGLEIRIEENEYVTNDKKEFIQILKDTIDYLNEEQIEFTADDSVAQKIINIEKQNAEFVTIAREIGNLNAINDVSSTNFVRLLKPYQKDAVAQLLILKHGANFSVPGSGKTTVVYAYFNKLRDEGLIDKIFVVGPISSFTPWEEESGECFSHKLKCVRLTGNKRESKYFTSDQYDLFLCHYQTATNDIDQIIELCSKYKILLVIDESHYIKRFSGGAWSDALIAISPYATRRVILSGTPMPNGYIDLWSQFTFLWPGMQLLGERNEYRKKAEDVIKQDQIKARIRPFFFRVKKIDLELPKQNIIRKYYDLKPVQHQIYQALSIRFLKDLELEPSDRLQLKMWRKAKMVRLLQAASNPTLLTKYSDEFAIPPMSADGSSVIQLINKYSQFEVPSKFEIAKQLVLDLMAQGEKVLLWTSFVHNITMLQTIFAEVPHYIIHGSVPKDESENYDFNRDKNIKEFKKSTKPCLLIANPAACAESISLHRACNHAIYLDRTFNCGQYIQSLDRIHRIGSDKNVNYYILLANDTIDLTIDRRIEEKFLNMNRVLEDELPVGSLDTDAYEMEITENEEERDFIETIIDVRKKNSEAT
jgi:SNF2 family DNA or RNA helicase